MRVAAGGDDLENARFEREERLELRWAGIADESAHRFKSAFCWLDYLIT